MVITLSLVCIITSSIFKPSSDSSVSINSFVKTLFRIPFMASDTSPGEEAYMMYVFGPAFIGAKPELGRLNFSLLQ